MPKINWEKVWKRALNSNKKFPTNVIKNNTISVSCPTRFSGTGKFAIDITPTFNDSYIKLDLLIFNDNVSVEDFSLKNKGKKYKDFNALSDKLVEYELSNRLSTQFEIESKGFKDDDEAFNALVDYINNKATESGRMFDDKLDELNDTLAGTTTKVEVDESDVKYMNILNSIRESRSFILKKIESILNKNYGWKASKNEEFSDSTTSIYDKNGNLAAVVSLVDKFIIVDLAKDITAKISIMQSDEEIEQELTHDISDADAVLADREIEQLKDVVSNTTSDMTDDYDPSLHDGFKLEELSRRVSRLENIFIERKLCRMK